MCVIAELPVLCVGNFVCADQERTDLDCVRRLFLGTSAAAAHSESTALQLYHSGSEFDASIDNRDLSRELGIIAEPLLGASQNLQGLFRIAIGEQAFPPLS